MAKTTKLVPREGKDGIRFYVSNDALEAYKILNNGVRINVRATPTTCKNCKVLNNAKRRTISKEPEKRSEGHLTKNPLQRTKRTCGIL